MPHTSSTDHGGPRAIGSIVARLLSRTGYDREQSSGLLAEAWEKSVPPGCRGRSSPGLVRRGVLEVFVSHSAIVQEIGFHERELVAKLAALVPSEGITGIRCRLSSDAGGEPSGNHGGT